MKKFLFSLFLAAAVCAFAKDQYDIKPDAAKAGEALSAVDWQNKNDAALKAATDEATLAAFVADEASAKALLAQVKGAYLTDPLVARQVAAVSQYVIPWYGSGFPSSSFLVISKYDGHLRPAFTRRISRSYADLRASLPTSPQRRTTEQRSAFRWTQRQNGFIS